MNYDKIEGHRVGTKVYVSDDYLYLNLKERSRYQETMQIRLKKRIRRKL